jgi:hypothetical protein
MERTCSFPSTLHLSNVSFYRYPLPFLPPPFLQMTLFNLFSPPTSNGAKICFPQRTKDPHATVKAHIKLLHDYNEIRDIGQGLMGIIADNRGLRVSDVYRDFDIAEGD